MFDAFRGHRCQRPLSDYLFLLFVLGTIAISRAYQLESFIHSRGGTGDLCAIIDGRSKIPMFQGLLITIEQL